LKRAVVATFGWAANLQGDAVYPYALVGRLDHSLLSEGLTGQGQGIKLVARTCW
jgi:hypothetical protein